MSCSRQSLASQCIAIAICFVAVGIIFDSVHAADSEEEIVRLTFDGRVKRDPVFWPDGHSIVYSTVTDEGYSRLMRLKLSDGSTQLFQPESNLPDRELAVSANGSVHAFVYVTTDGQRG